MIPEHETVAAQNDADVDYAKVVELMQAGMTVCDRPYAAVADKLGISEAALLQVLQQMQSQGVIRRIGVVPNHYALGYTHNLMTVWDIDDAEILTLGERVGALPFVSHSYQRPRGDNWPYNFFAMVHGRSAEEVEQKRQLIAEQLGDSCGQYTALRSTKILKKTGLRI